MPIKKIGIIRGYFNKAMRLERDELFMKIAELFSYRSTCTRAQVGSILVRENRIVSSGYVGSPPGKPHCLDIGCKIEPISGSCIRTLHSEINTLLFCAKYGIPTEKSVLYTTLSPCLNCAKAIIAGGVIEVVFRVHYKDIAPLKYLEEAKVKVRQLLYESDSI